MAGIADISAASIQLHPVSGLAAQSLALRRLTLLIRHETTRLLTFDERHFRAVTPLGGGSFTLFPADR